MLKGINDLELECIENAICLEDTTDESLYVKINIPKLMPMIDIADPIHRNIIINKNILLNESGSIPNIDIRIDSSNYIELPIPRDIKFKKGDSILVFIPNKNIKKMKIISI